MDIVVIHIIMFEQAREIQAAPSLHLLSLFFFVGLRAISWNWRWVSKLIYVWSGSLRRHHRANYASEPTTTKHSAVVPYCWLSHYCRVRLLYSLWYSPVLSIGNSGNHVQSRPLLLTYWMSIGVLVRHHVSRFIH